MKPTVRAVVAGSVSGLVLRAGAATVAAVALGLVACEPTPLETGPDADLLFLVQRAPPAGVMDALYQGRVDVDQSGCFRLSDDPARHTVVWPFGYGLARDDVSLVILDERGREAARVGHLLRLGGGEVVDLAALDLLRSDMLAAALERCPGRFWVAASVLPSEPRP